MNFVAIKGRFVGCIPRRPARISCSKQNNDWHLSLGMHNFRRVLKEAGEKSKHQSMVPEKGGKDVGKRELMRIRRRILRRNRAVARYGRRNRKNRRRRLLKYLRTDKRRYYRLLGRWERAAYKEAISVRRKSRKAISTYDEEVKRLRGALRVVKVRRTGQYWRHLRKMKSQERVISKVAIKLSEDSKVSARELRRKKWLFSNSWLKLPKSYLMNTKENFDKYCVRCKVLGHFTAFFLISNWRDPEAKRIKKMFEKKAPYDYCTGLSIFQSGVIPKEPHRSDYHNYKTWRKNYDHFFDLIDMAKANQIILRGVIISFDMDELNSYTKKA